MTTRRYNDCNSVPKEIARRVSMCGSYLNHTDTKLRRPPAKHVINLPASGNLDVRQGINEGLIAPNATIWGIESDASVINEMHRDAYIEGTNFNICHTDLRDYRPSHKVDMFIGDLMQRPGLWIGEFLLNHMVPNMKKRHSSIALNVYTQMVHSGVKDSHPDLFRDMFRDNPDAFLSKNAWDLERPQQRAWTAFDLDQRYMIPMPLAKSISFNDEITTGCVRDITNNGCFLSFVSIHHFMMQTDFRYGGCFLYRQNPKGQNSGKMLTLYYYRG